MSTDIYHRTKLYRLNYRKDNPLSINIRILHLVFIILLTLPGIYFSLINLANVQIYEWLVIPTIFIFGNFLIYLIHRFLLHIPISLFRYGYEKHTLMHHHYFTDELYGYDSLLELDVILFPFWFVFLIVLIVAPLFGYISSLFFSTNVAYLVAAMSIFMYLGYEVVHYCSHLEETALIHRIPFFRYMRNHHKSHHKLTQMNKVNFDIIIVSFDYLFKTFKA